MIRRMEAPVPNSTRKYWIALALACTLSLMLLATLAGWARYGTSILYTYAQAGIAWCL